MLRRLTIVALGLTLLASALVASAQPQPAPPPSASNPVQDAVATQLGNLIIANTQCGQQALALTNQLRATQDELAKVKADLAKLQAPVQLPPPAPKAK